MGTAFRDHPITDRGGIRIPIHTRVQCSTVSGEVLSIEAWATNIGLGGMRVTARQILSPGTSILLRLRLPAGRSFGCLGEVAWSHETLRPALFGRTDPHDDDASFGIAFRNMSPEDLLPIARLIAARDQEKLRARRIRTLHGLPNHTSRLH